MRDTVPIVVKFTGKSTLVKEFIFDPTVYDVIHFTIDWGCHKKAIKYTTLIKHTDEWYRGTKNFIVSTVFITLYKLKFKDFVLFKKKNEILEDDANNVIINPKYEIYLDNEDMPELQLEKILQHWTKDPRSGKAHILSNTLHRERVKNAS
jgi:hypothetical protein